MCVSVLHLTLAYVFLFAATMSLYQEFLNSFLKLPSSSVFELIEEYETMCREQVIFVLQLLGKGLEHRSGFFVLFRSVFPSLFFLFISIGAESKRKS